MSKPLTNPTLAMLRALLTAPPSPPRPVLSPSTCRPLPPFPEKAPKAKRLSRAVALEIEIKARRDPLNRAEHVRMPYLGPTPKTHAAAAKLRREAMLMCPCRLCALALYPPTTFEEYARLQLAEPSFDCVEALQVLRRTEPRPYTHDVAERLGES
jgi:hypothetical protein